MVTAVNSDKVKSKVSEYKDKHKLVFNEILCKGCDLCVHICPKNILKLDKTRVTPKGYNPAVCFDIANCIACGMCGIICPDSVITVERDAV
ncbi:MAG: 4Fe-4S dicluster domain-containing protein [Defluviitaleaceae bacterium]|nr:4Fe-4S dicluster domain-containing protein [Defluviitaleaceae bacterium]